MRHARALLQLVLDKAVGKAAVLAPHHLDSFLAPPMHTHPAIHPPYCRLGMDLDKALEEAAVLTPPLLAAWLGTEAQRDAARWQPRRAAGTARRGILQERDADAEGGEEGEEAEARVQLREVAPLLVSLGESSPLLRESSPLLGGWDQNLLLRVVVMVMGGRCSGLTCAVLGFMIDRNACHRVSWPPADIAPCTRCMRTRLPPNTHPQHSIAQY